MTGRITRVEIMEIRRETPTVRSFTLDLGEQEFTFLPGQWVDCYLDAEGKWGVAGYTITSSPTKKGTIDLTVRKGGDNPVTRFLHEEVHVGDTLFIDGGQGEFYYSREMGDSLVLIAGGIGVTPLMSMLRYVHDSTPEARAQMIYSARVPSEIIFRRELEEISDASDRISCVFTVTRPGDEAWEGRRGRITSEILETVDRDALFYICGPPPMGQEMTELLAGLGASRDRIMYEQWW